jgi:hypothetical protein
MATASPSGVGAPSHKPVGVLDNVRIHAHRPALYSGPVARPKHAWSGPVDATAPPPTLQPTGTQTIGIPTLQCGWIFATVHVVPMGCIATGYYTQPQWGKLKQKLADGSGEGAHSHQNIIWEHVDMAVIFRSPSYGPNPQYIPTYATCTVWRKNHIYNCDLSRASRYYAPRWSARPFIVCQECGREPEKGTVPCSTVLHFLVLQNQPGWTAQEPRLNFGEEL